MATSANSLWVRNAKQTSGPSGVHFGDDTYANAANAFTSTAGKKGSIIVSATSATGIALAADSKDSKTGVSTATGAGTAALASSVVAVGQHGLKSGSGAAGGKLLHRRSKAPVKNKATVVSILGGMKQQPRFGKMLEYSLECLKKLAVDEASVEEMIENGAIETMVAIMKLNEKNERLQQLFNEVLQAFARNEYLAGLIAERMGGNFKPFANSLTDHQQIETHMSTISMLGTLNRCEANVDLMVKSKIPESLAHCVQVNEKDPALLTNAAQTLIAFTRTPPHAAIVYGTGVVQIILKAALANPQNQALVKAAALLLANVLVNCPSSAQALKRLGALEFLIAALEGSPFDDELLDAARRAFKLLTAQSDLNLALATMSAGVKNDKGTAAQLFKISSLMLVEENVDYIYKNGGVDWLLAIVKANNGPGSEDAANRKKMLAASCRGILRCAIGNESRIYTIMAKGGVQQLIAVLTANASDELIAQAALSALGALIGSRKENGIYIAQSGGITAALAVLKALPGSAPVARAALDFFNNMASHLETGALLIAGGVIPATCALLGAHSKNAAIAMTAIRTLGQMMTSEENIQKMVQAGLLPLLLAVLKDHPDDLELARTALLAIETACLCPENIPILRKLGAIEVITGVLARWPDDDELREIGMRALALLGGEAEVNQQLADSEEEARKKREAEDRAREEARRKMQEEAERLAKSQMDEAAWAAMQARQAEEDAKAAAEAAARKAAAPKTGVNVQDMERKRLEEEMAYMVQKLKESEERAQRARDDEAARKAAEKARLDALAAAEAARLAAEAKAKAEREAKVADQPAMQELGHLRRMLALAAGGTEAAAAIAPPKPVLAKSARALFANDGDDSKRERIELETWVKNFLWAGLLLKLHGESGKSRHLYLTQDLNYIIWKSPKKDIAPDSKMEIHRIVHIDRGLITDELKKTRFGVSLDPLKCFALTGTDMAEGKRKMSFEANSAAECEKMVQAIDRLMEYARDIKMYGSSTVFMQDNALHTGQKKLIQKAT